MSQHILIFQSATRLQLACSVIHTHAAVQFLLEHFHTVSDPYRNMVAELLAFTSGTQHGLFDCVDKKHRLGFSRRLHWDDNFYQEATAVFLDMASPIRMRPTLRKPRVY